MIPEFPVTVQAVQQVSKSVISGEYFKADLLKCSTYKSLISKELYVKDHVKVIKLSKA
jgi:hypothetical protein